MGGLLCLLSRRIKVKRSAGLILALAALMAVQLASAQLTPEQSNRLKELETLFSRPFKSPSYEVQNFPPEGSLPGLVVIKGQGEWGRFQLILDSDSLELFSMKDDRVLAREPLPVYDFPVNILSKSEALLYPRKLVSTRSVSDLRVIRGRSRQVTHFQMTSQPEDKKDDPLFVFVTVDSVDGEIAEATVIKQPGGSSNWGQTAIIEAEQAGKRKFAQPAERFSVSAVTVHWRSLSPDKEPGARPELICDLLILDKASGPSRRVAYSLDRRALGEPMEPEAESDLQKEAEPIKPQGQQGQSLPPGAAPFLLIGGLVALLLGAGLIAAKARKR